MLYSGDISFGDIMFWCVHVVFLWGDQSISQSIFYFTPVHNEVIIDTFVWRQHALFAT